jgi:hypothetical protein
MQGPATTLPAKGIAQNCLILIFATAVALATKTLAPPLTPNLPQPAKTRSCCSAGSMSIETIGYRNAHKRFDFHPKGGWHQRLYLRIVPLFVFVPGIQPRRGIR